MTEFAYLKDELKLLDYRDEMIEICVLEMRKTPAEPGSFNSFAGCAFTRTHETWGMIQHWLTLCDYNSVM